MDEQVKTKKPIWKRWWFWGIVLIVVIILASSGGSKSTTNPAPGEQTQTTTTEQEKTSASTPKSPKSNAIKAGMYKVGQDIPAGEYVLVTNSQGYFEITKDSSGQLDSVICNDMFEKRSIVTVNEGEYFKFQNAEAYPIDKAPKVEATNGILPSGMYKVGVDIAPGEYKIKAIGDGYVEVAKDSRHLLNSIVSNDMFTGEKYVTVADGQYIKLRNAELILKQ